LPSHVSASDHEPTIFLTGADYDKFNTKPPPVRSAACTQRRLYAAPPVRSAACTQRRLYAAPPVRSAACTQRRLNAAPPVRSAGCTQRSGTHGYHAHRSLTRMNNYCDTE